jgi:hypothetical protein
MACRGRSRRNQKLPYQGRNPAKLEMPIGTDGAAEVRGNARHTPWPNYTKLPLLGCRRNTWPGQISIRTVYTNTTRPHWPASCAVAWPSAESRETHASACRHSGGGCCWSRCRPWRAAPARQQRAPPSQSPWLPAAASANADAVAPTPADIPQGAPQGIAPPRAAGAGGLCFVCSRQRSRRAQPQALPPPLRSGGDRDYYYLDRADILLLLLQILPRPPPLHSRPGAWRGLLWMWRWQGLWQQD